MIDLLYIQAVLYLQNNNNLLEEGTELGEQDLLAFSNIRVSIHHVITDRIDHLRPSQQLTLKVSHSAMDKLVLTSCCLVAAAASGCSCRAQFSTLLSAWKLGYDSKSQQDKEAKLHCDACFVRTFHKQSRGSPHQVVNMQCQDPSACYTTPSTLQLYL